MSERTEHLHCSMVLEWDPEDEVYVVTVPQLPGCRSHAAMLNRWRYVELPQVAPARVATAGRNDPSLALRRQAQAVLRQPGPGGFVPVPRLGRDGLRTVGRPRVTLSGLWWAAASLNPLKALMA